MSKQSKAETEEEKIRQIVLEYFGKRAEFKNLQADFEEVKQQFNNVMEAYFQESGITSMKIESNELVEGDLLVTRVQKLNVSFDADKLESVLNRELVKRVICKQYVITDILGLVEYLKKCKVDPKVFKSFLSITKTVDTKELDRLEEVGKVTLNQIKDCYVTNAQRPYFVVKVKRKGKSESD